MKKTVSIVLAITLVALANENFSKISKVATISSNVCTYFGKDLQEISSTGIAAIFLGYIVIDSCLRYFSAFDEAVASPQVALP